MFANFTEELCAGTGNTLALSGATTGNIPFSVSYDDGDLVAYVVEDSGGTIKAAGVGTYVASTDDITRNDTWNWNGTVIDNNPATNITLSVGTHTVRCDMTEKDLLGLPRATNGMPGYLRDAWNASSTSVTVTADDLYLTGIFIPGTVDVTSLGNFEVSTANGTKFRVGIYSTLENGYPDQLLVESADIDCSTTGYSKLSSVSHKLQRGLYAIGIISDGTPRVSGSDITRAAFPYFGTNSGTSIIIALRYAHTVGWSTLPTDLSSASFTKETYNTALGAMQIS